MSRRKVGDIAPASGRPSASDPETPAARDFIALLEALRPTGGAVPGDVVSRLLGEPAGAGAISLARLVEKAQVFGFEWRASLWIPMFQFDAHDWAVKAGARRVRAELPAPWPGWTVASWFAAANAGLEGRRPADLLDSNLDAVIRVARALVPNGASRATCAAGRRRHELAFHV